MKRSATRMTTAYIIQFLPDCVLEGQLNPGTAAASCGAERSVFWIPLAVSIANVGLAVWRPRLPQVLGHQRKAQKQRDPLCGLDISEGVETPFDT
jgi:hypothetical protein